MEVERCLHCRIFYLIVGWVIWCPDALPDDNQWCFCRGSNLIRSKVRPITPTLRQGGQAQYTVLLTNLLFIFSFASSYSVLQGHEPTQPQSTNSPVNPHGACSFNFNRIGNNRYWGESPAGLWIEASFHDWMTPIASTRMTKRESISKGRIVNFLKFGSHQWLRRWWPTSQ